MEINKQTGRLNSKSKHSLGTIQDIMKKQNLMTSLEGVVNTEKDVFEEGVSQISSLAKYVKSNWKAVVPAMATLAIGAYFLKGRGRKRR